MKRSSELRRRTPLEAKSPLRRKTALSASPTARSSLHAASAARMAQPKRSRPGVPAKVRNALKARSGGLCEVAQPGCTGAATEAAHRLKRGMGGRKGAALKAHDVLSNLLHLDWHCHRRLGHAQPKEAYASGWMIREGEDPMAERVLYRGAWRWLDDLGAVLTTPPPTTAQEAI